MRVKGAKAVTEADCYNPPGLYKVWRGRKEIADRAYPHNFFLFGRRRLASPNQERWLWHGLRLCLIGLALSVDALEAFHASGVN
jgi:hypothetical protein